MGKIKVEMLDIVCNPTAHIPFRHRLGILACTGAAEARIRTSAGRRVIGDARVGTLARTRKRSIIAVPDVNGPSRATITIPRNGTAEVDTGPVPDFEIVMMPTSHLCFGFNSCLPEHIEAGRVVAGAVDQLERDPSYRWNLEFTRGAQNLLKKYPAKAAQARRQYREGRLSIGPIWAPSIFPHYEGESHVRQLAEAQWWLRENFGSASPVAMSCDSPGFDPQQPQLLRQAGIEFVWHCRYSHLDKDFGSPFLEHVGADGTRLPCFTARRPLARGYITWRLFEELRLKEGRQLDGSDAAEFGRIVAELGEYLRNAKEICGADFNVHFTGNDQTHADPAEATTAAAWNRAFRTPTLRLATTVEAARRLLRCSAFRRDEQEGEQPDWLPITIAGFRLTLPLQEAAYALATAEKAAAMDAVVNGAPYPALELRTAWLSVLGEQQHEQLGDGAHDLVEHSMDLVLRATAVARDITRCSLRRTASKINFTRPEQAVTVFNLLNWSRRHIVETEADGGGNVVVRDAAGHAVPHDVSESGTLRFMADVEGMGYSTYYIGKSRRLPRPARDLKASSTRIENAFYRLDVDAKTGCVLSLFDKEHRTLVAGDAGDRLPFELVVHEDCGAGYGEFWPTGRLWRASQLAGASVRTAATALSARLVVERPLLAARGKGRVGSGLRIEYELPSQTKRLDVRITLDWDSEIKRELRLFLPLAMESPDITYDTLFAASTYDPDLSSRQRMYHLRADPGVAREHYPRELIDHRNVTRFVSAHDRKADFAATLTAPHGLLRVEHGGVSFTLLEDRTDLYTTMIPSMKGRHVFDMSLTSHRGDWKKSKAWRFGWEHRGRFNPLVPVVPDRLYPVLPEAGRLVEIDGEDLVLTALKLSHEGEDLVARVYDAGGTGDRFGFRPVSYTHLTLPTN